jgi:glycosyltransferase involved in cell wall biosynthesis
VIGPTPPPVHGTAVYTRMLLDSPILSEAFEVAHLDISDRRGLENVGRLDPTNVGLALRHLAALVGRLVRDRPDVVYVPVSQNALAYLRDGLFIALARAAGAAVVSHLHGGYFGTFYRSTPAPVRAFVRATSRLLDQAWVLGEGLRHHYEVVLPPDRVRVVPNGVPDPLRGEEAPVRDDGAGPMGVLFLGQLSEAKGLHEVVEAVGRLRADGIGVGLTLAGPWATEDQRRRTLELLERRGLADSTRLPGVVTGQEKRRLLCEHDVFVLPTRYRFEGQPLAILEAMAAALPVVSTRRGAIPDMVVDGLTGRLVPEEDPSALAAALAELARDPALRRAMGRAGRVRWRELFTEERCLRRFVSALGDGGPEEGRRLGPTVPGAEGPP